MDKSIFKSKTFWFGVLQITISMLQYVQGSLETGVALSLTGFLTIVLRFLTNTGVKI